MVLVEDECKVQKESGVMRIWYPRGKQPQIKVSQTKESVSFYGALDVATGKATALEAPWQNSAITVKFLELLEKQYQGKDALLIWDGAPWHRGEVKKYLKRKDKKWNLELMYFPAYSPDMNPQEELWKLTKGHTTHNSEEDFETRTQKFGSYLVNTKFKTNFLQKYS